MNMTKTRFSRFFISVFFILILLAGIQALLSCYANNNSLSEDHFYHSFSTTLFREGTFVYKNAQHDKILLTMDSRSGIMIWVQNEHKSLTAKEPFLQLFQLDPQSKKNLIWGNIDSVDNKVMRIKVGYPEALIDPVLLPYTLSVSYNTLRYINITIPVDSNQPQKGTKEYKFINIYPY